MPPVVSLMQAVRYCERGSSAEFWAEPLNAITNAAYVAAALVGWALVRSSRLSNPDRGWLICLIALIASIGVGSAAFHTAPSVLTKLGDVVPIALFVVAALFVALTRVLSMSVPVAFGQLALLGAVSVVIARGGEWIGCVDGSCLNGAPGYLPVLAALVMTASAVWRAKSASAPSLMLASGAFAAALTARTLDLVACPLGTIGSIAITAHALWHLGTALTAYLVLRGLALGLRVTS